MTRSSYGSAPTVAPGGGAVNRRRSALAAAGAPRVTADAAGGRIPGTEP
jgi:hypothetical protein